MSKNKQKQHGTDKAQNQQPQSQTQSQTQPSDYKDSKSEPQGAKNQQKNK